MDFTTFGLPEKILQGVWASGYSVPTEIQQKAIPVALEGRDILGCAPTGTGKTAAFVLPILTQLIQTPVNHHHPRVLILTPTRELAQQIEDSVFDYGTYTNVQPLSVYGGVGIREQISELKKGVDIVIATPGRLLDHMERHSISLSHIEILVLDEADRMYDMGFIHDVRKIISHVPRQRQTMLFSATMPREIRSLIAEILQSPAHIDVGVPFTPVELVEQHFFYAPQQVKLDLLIHILKTVNIDTALVFSRTKHGADRIARRLMREKISSSTIHADRTQSQRQQALDGFKRRDFQVLVATDIAARGIDVEQISCVINFETPEFPEDYIHRIGRTGRADCKGAAVTFVSDDERKNLKRIEFLTRKKYEVKEYPGFKYPEKPPEPQVAPYLLRKRKYYRTPRFAFK